MRWRWIHIPVWVCLFAQNTLATRWKRNDIPDLFPWDPLYREPVDGLSPYSYKEPKEGDCVSNGPMLELFDFPLDNCSMHCTSKAECFAFSFNQTTGCKLYGIASDAERRKSCDTNPLTWVKCRDDACYDEIPMAAAFDANLTLLAAHTFREIRDCFVYVVAKAKYRETLLEYPNDRDKLGIRQVIWSSDYIKNPGTHKAATLIDTAMYTMSWQDPGTDYYYEVWNVGGNLTAAASYSEPLQHPDSPHLVSAPDIVILGTTQVSPRKDDLSPLSRLIEYSVLTDGFDPLLTLLRTFVYDLRLNDEWYGLPILSDYFVMLANLTTIGNHNLNLPPPHGKWGTNFRKKWTWRTFSLYLNSITEEGGPNGTKYGLTFEPARNNELYLFTTLIRSPYQGLLSTPDPSGIWTCQLREPNIVQAVNDTLVRWWRTDRSADPDYFNHSDPTFQKWIADYPNVDLTNAPWAEESGAAINKSYGLHGFSWARAGSLHIYGMHPSKMDALNLTSLNNISLVYVPGGITFLGGSAVGITAYTQNSSRAWEYVTSLVNPSFRFVNEINYNEGVLPPYESAWENIRWNASIWSFHQTFIRGGLPLQYPYYGWEQMAEIKQRQIFRTLFTEISDTNATIEEALNHTCTTMDWIMAPECTEIDWVAHKNGSCGIMDAKKYITYSWKLPVKCRYGMQLPEPTSVTCNFVGMGNIRAILVDIFTGIAIFGAVAALVQMTRQRHHPAIRSSSFPLSFPIVIGSILSYISVILVDVAPTTAACTAWIVALFVGNTMVFGSFLLKLFRIWYLFKYVAGTPNKHQLNLTDKRLLLYLFVMMVAVGAVCVAYYLGDSLSIDYVTVTGGTNGSQTLQPVYFEIHAVPLQHCNYLSSKHWSLPLLSAFLAVLIVGCCAVSWLVRDVPVQYRESRWILAASYSALFMFIVLFFVYPYISEFNARFILLTVTILLHTTATLQVYALPKLFVAHNLLEPSGPGCSSNGDGFLQNNFSNEIPSTSIAVSRGDLLSRSQRIGNSSSEMERLRSIVKRQSVEIHMLKQELGYDSSEITFSTPRSLPTGLGLRGCMSGNMMANPSSTDNLDCIELAERIIEQSWEEEGDYLQREKLADIHEHENEHEHEHEHEGEEELDDNEQQSSSVVLNRPELKHT